MPAINKFYQFATLASSDNILSDGQYEADDQRLSGNVPGIARQQLVNKCLKQAAAIAYAFGEAASVNSNMEVSDDGAGLTNITDYLTKALLPGYSASDANKYVRINSQGTGIVYVTIPPASTTVAGLTRYATTTEANAGTIADAAVTPAGLKAFSDGHQNITGNAATASKLQTARTITLSGNDASGSVSFDGSANVQLPVAVAQANKLRTPRSIGISAFNAPAVPFDGTANIDLGVDSIPVNLLDGVISQANLPRIVFTEVVDVANQAARFALTKTQVQNGDMVYQLDTQVMYIVVNDDMLSSEDGYKVIGGQVASKAIADQNGNVIDTYYMPKGGGTFTGAINVAAGISGISASFTDTVSSLAIACGNNIEMIPPTTAGHGGYIDFHFNGSTEDYTSRIIEDGSGQLSFVANSIKVQGVLSPLGNNTLDLGTLVTKFKDGYINHVVGYADAALSPAYLSIRANADLDDYQTKGHYVCGEDAVAATVVNTPTGGLSFSMDVIDTVGENNSSYKMQIVHQYNTGYIYTRVFVDAVWRTWQRLATMSDIPIASDTSIVKEKFQNLGTISGTTANIDINNGQVIYAKLSKADGVHPGINILNTTDNPAMARTVTLILAVDATVDSVTWGNGILWSGGSAPEFDGSPTTIIVTLISFNNGDYWYGVVANRFDYR